jgi:hypothetical protein
MINIKIMGIGCLKFGSNGGKNKIARLGIWKNEQNEKNKVNSHILK